jgi:hypothetical protein
MLVSYMLGPSVLARVQFVKLYLSFVCARMTWYSFHLLTNLPLYLPSKITNYHSSYGFSFSAFEVKDVMIHPSKYQTVSSSCGDVSQRAMCSI